MFEYFKAVKEFGIASALLNQVMIPSISREERREYLNAMINTLSDNTFKRDMIFKRIMSSNMIDMSKEISSEYEDTDKQIQGLLSWLPRMEYHKDKLYKVVRNNRRKYGLKL